MSRSVLLALASAATVFAAMPAAAQSVDQNVRCFLASNAFVKAEKDPAKRQIALASFFFYFGRVDAQMSPAELKTRALAVGKTMNQQNAGPIMTACAQQLQAKQRGLQALSPGAAQGRPKK